RGVAVALLVDETHWVVVHQYVENDDGTIEIFYRDGLHPKLSSETPWNSFTFRRDVFEAGGFYSGKYVAVTAAAARGRLPGWPANPPSRGGPTRPTRPAELRSLPQDVSNSVVQPFSDMLGREIAARLGRKVEWGVAFAGALQRFVLKVEGTHP